MFVLLATVCLSADVNTCGTLGWTKETFPTEKACAEAALVLLPELQKDFYFVNGRCFVVPSTPNV
jgi:hypothetical protein